MFIELTLFYSRRCKTRKTHGIFVRTSKNTWDSLWEQTRKSDWKIKTHKHVKKTMNTHLPSTSVTSLSCIQPWRRVATQFISYRRALQIMSNWAILLLSAGTGRPWSTSVCLLITCRTIGYGAEPWHSAMVKAMMCGCVTADKNYERREVKKKKIRIASGPQLILSFLYTFNVGIHIQYLILSK